jgi:hypothetical protein
MKRAIAVVAVLVGTLVVTAPAEAANTSEKEGRKYSRKYVKQTTPLGFGKNSVQHQCYRISRRGVGNYRIYPGGVVCAFSEISRGRCYLLGIAVKDGKRRIQAANIGAVYPYRGDRADCDRGAPDPEWPGAWEGITGDPLRPIV